MTNNIKNLNSNYINLLSHALFKINKMAKIARDGNWMYEEYSEEEDKHYDESEMPFMSEKEWYFKNYADYGEECIFCVEKGPGFFYDLKDQILNRFYEAGLLVNMGYHKFPDGPYTCFGFGKHTFHRYGIWDNAEYAGDIDGMISSSINESTKCSRGSNKFNKFFSWNINDIPEWEEALFIINDFIDGTYYCLDEIIEEEYGCA